MKKTFLILSLISTVIFAKASEQKNITENSKNLTLVKKECQWYTFTTSDGEVFHVYANSASEARDEVIRILIDREGV